MIFNTRKSFEKSKFNIRLLDVKILGSLDHCYEEEYSHGTEHKANIDFAYSS
jgi:hypothetical protein